MKTMLLAIALCAVSSANATTTEISAKSGTMVSMGQVASVFETKGRTGSKRVGGTGRNGKGGRYVGGHK